MTNIKTGNLDFTHTVTEKKQKSTSAVLCEEVVQVAGQRLPTVFHPPVQPGSYLSKPAVPNSKSDTMRYPIRGRKTYLRNHPRSCLKQNIKKSSILNDTVKKKLWSVFDNLLNIRDFSSVPPNGSNQRCVYHARWWTWVWTEADYRNSPATSWVFSGIYDRHLHDLWISPDWCNARLHPSVHSWRPPSFVFAVFHSFSHISNCSCSDLAESSPFGFASTLSPQAALGLGFTRLRPTKTIKWPCRLVLRSNPETWLLVWRNYD